MQKYGLACKEYEMNIGVLDYGAGNLKNVCRAVEHLGYSYTLVPSNEELMGIDKLIIPGVGAYKVAMEQLHKLDLVLSIREFSKSGAPILGICLGMQLLLEKSFEYGETEGLGLIKGEVILIPTIGNNGQKHKVPHIGWNELLPEKGCEHWLSDFTDGNAVYFVHSYMASLKENDNLVSYVNYDDLRIPGVIEQDNVLGCQFHPEKSGSVGLKILNEFLKR